MKFSGISIKKLGKSNTNNRNGRKKDRLTCKDQKNSNNKRDKELSRKEEEINKKNILNKNPSTRLKMLVRVRRKIKYSMRKILNSKIQLEQILRRKSNKFP